MKAKTRFLPFLLALIMALTCCLPLALADGVSNELNVPITPKSVGNEQTDGDMTLSIALSPSTVKPDGTVGVVLTLTNSTGADVTGASMTCALPAGVVPTNPSLSGYDSGAGTVTWTGNIDAAKSAELGFDVTMPATAGAYTFNATSIVGGTSGPATSADATVIDAAKVLMTMAVSNPTPKPGDYVTYTVTLQNEGDTAATGLELACQIPAGLTEISDVTDNTAPVSGVINWNVDVPGNDSVTRSFKGRIPAAASIGAQYTATASVPELDLTASATAMVTNYALTLSIVANASRVRAGESVLYTVSMTNSGNMAAPGVALTSGVPSGMSVSGISDSGSLTGSQISWTTFDLAAGTTVTRTYAGAIPSTASTGSVYTNTAAAYGLNANVSVTVYDDEPDLYIKKTVNNRTPEPGASVRYTITVTNKGGADADDVTVIDTLPADMEVIESSISGNGTYRSSSHRVVWTADVPEGDKVTLTFRAWVPDDAEEGDTYVNRARIEDGDSAKCTIVVTEDAVPKTGEAPAPAGEAPVPAAWWKKFAPSWGGATETATEGGDGEMLAAEEIEDEPLPEVQQGFQELYAKNNELAGWLSVPGVADLPVLQATNNDYYMSHDFDGKEDSAGALFLDERNALYPGDQHMLIYGHNMKSGAMFGKLSQYRDLSYLKSNPVLSFQSVYDAEPTHYVVVAVLDASMDASHAEYLKIRRPNFDDEEDGKAFLGTVASFSYYDIPVEVDETDPLLTLVTCSYLQSNGRLLVIARPLREGETYEDVTALMDGAATKTPVRTSVQA